MSATVNVEFYRRLYGERVKFVDVGNVEAQGVVIQNTKFSLSQQSLAENLGEVKEMIASLGENLPVITFRKYKKEFKNFSQEFHYGKTSGRNVYSGRDIVVVGTPHRRKADYLLYAKAFGIEVTPSDFEMSQRRVRHNGCEFRITTFAKEEIQQIQFALIEDQIKQAVGRARTLRNPAIVYLLSGFPLAEAAITEEEIAEALEKVESHPNRQQIVAASKAADTSTFIEEIDSDFIFDED